MPWCQAAGGLYETIYFSSYGSFSVQQNRSHQRIGTSKPLSINIPFDNWYQPIDHTIEYLAANHSPYQLYNNKNKMAAKRSSPCRARKMPPFSPAPATFDQTKEDYAGMDPPAPQPEPKPEPRRLRKALAFRMSPRSKREPSTVDIEKSFSISGYRRPGGLPSPSTTDDSTDQDGQAIVQKRRRSLQDRGPEYIKAVFRKWAARARPAPTTTIGPSRVTKPKLINGSRVVRISHSPEHCICPDAPHRLQEGLLSGASILLERFESERRGSEEPRTTSRCGVAFASRTTTSIVQSKGRRKRRLPARYC